MTPQLLQKDVCEDIRACLADLRFPNPHGEPVPISVFRHALPVPRHKDYSDMEYNEMETAADPGLKNQHLEADPVELAEDDPFPYVIVRISQGNVKDPDHSRIVSMLFIIGVYDDAETNEGVDGVLNIIERIYRRYAENPIVHGGKAKIHFDGEQQLFHWVIQDDDTWPYFFGAVQAEFEIMPIERVSKYT